MPNYSGIWTEQAVMQANGAGNWPNAPGAPTIGTATNTGAGGTVSVAFTAPTFAGLPAVITGYTVTSSPGGLTGTGASSPITVSGLTNGTAYTFTVTATNSSGTGPASAASNSVTPTLVVYVEEVFSTYLYTGTGSPTGLTVNNGIDLATKGGLLWCKNRTTGATPHYLFDTARNFSYTNASSLNTASTAAQESQGTNYAKPETTGFSFGDGAGTTSPNKSGDAFASWTFREQAKFFDVVTFTKSTVNLSVPHNLGSVPGCIIIKRTDGADEWYVYHRGVSSATRNFLKLNRTFAAEDPGGVWITPTSTTFDLTSYAIPNDGNTYVAYLFAHDAGGFGLTGTDNVISCGSFTSNATVTLGYEPQWVMVKATSGAGDWMIADTMRGMAVGSSSIALYPNLSTAEGNDIGIFPTATGFTTSGYSGTTFIYIAIRRGPMKVPTSGTSVFAPFNTSVTSNPLSFTSNFPVDFALTRKSNGLSEQIATSRLQGGAYLDTTSTAAEAAPSPPYWTFDSNTQITSKYWNAGFGTVQSMLAFKRAPSFFDEVCYTGTGANLTLTHNLTVPPELIIIKARDKVENWVGWSKYGPASGSDFLSGNVNDTASFIYTRVIGTPTGTQLTVSSNGETSGSSFKYVAYLFATCAGVSKVGSYTGTATTLQIDCGFTAGARFVLIKRTDSTGDWYVWDSARGIIAGNDPYLLLNSTAAEVTNTDYVDTAATGFEISSTAPAAINANGGTFIFLAIA